MSHDIPAAGDDEVGQHWMELIAREWDEELSDPRQDIYTLADGVPTMHSPDLDYDNSTSTRPSPSLTRRATFNV